jgi:hypothetical protein
LDSFLEYSRLQVKKRPNSQLDRAIIDSERVHVKRLGLIVSFLVGAAMLIYAFGIGYAGWWEFADRMVVASVLLSALGVAVVFLTTMGTLARGKGRWTPFTLAAILLLGFSALTFFSLGIYVAPVGLLLLGFSIWKLAHHPTKCVTLE